MTTDRGANRSVRLLIAGGTIAMSGSPARPSPAVIEELQRQAGGRVEAEEFLVAPSVHFSPAQALSLCRRAVAIARAGTPVVVTHGTDLLEEVAFLCDLIHDAGGADRVHGRDAGGVERRGPTAPRTCRTAVQRRRHGEAVRGLGVRGRVRRGRCTPHASSARRTAPAVDAFSSPQKRSARITYEERRVTIACGRRVIPRSTVVSLDASVEILTAAPRDAAGELDGRR